jgi:taurine dioxygenase
MTTMLTIERGDASLGAKVTGVDLARPLSESDFGAVLRALGEHGVLCFPNQPIDAAALRRFSGASVSCR